MSEITKPRDLRLYLRWAKKRIKRLEETYDGTGNPVTRNVASMVKVMKLLSWAIEDLAARLEPMLGLEEEAETKDE